MSSSFQTAGEVMEHLREQIVQFHRGGDGSMKEAQTQKPGTRMDLSKLEQECRSHHVLWEVSAERPITSHRKFVGVWIVLGKRAMRKWLRWYVGGAFELQSAFNGSVTRSIHEVRNLLAEIIAYLHSLKAAESRIRRLEQELSALRMELSPPQPQDAQTSSPPAAGHRKPDPDPVEFDYLRFENQFRGSVEEIKHRQKEYIPYFRNRSNVLDIGCGRGEFLELMRDHGIEARGIDINEDMIQYCQSRGLAVAHAAAAEYLHSVEDHSLGGIFISHVVEHLDYKEMIGLIQLAYHKLQHGSVILIETPNPGNLALYHNAFYIDPTHTKPVHPLLVHFLLESVGFYNIKLNYSGAVDEERKLSKLRLASDPEMERQMNKIIEKLNETIYGYQDYAIVAWK